MLPGGGDLLNGTFLNLSQSLGSERFKPSPSNRDAGFRDEIQELRVTLAKPHSLMMADQAPKAMGRSGFLTPQTVFSVSLAWIDFLIFP